MLGCCLTIFGHDKNMDRYGVLWCFAINHYGKTIYIYNSEFQCVCIVWNSLRVKHEVLDVGVFIECHALIHAYLVINNLSLIAYACIRKYVPFTHNETFPCKTMVLRNVRAFPFEEHPIFWQFYTIKSENKLREKHV